MEKEVRRTIQRMAVKLDNTSNNSTHKIMRFQGLLDPWVVKACSLVTRNLVALTLKNLKEVMISIPIRYSLEAPKVNKTKGQKRVAFIKTT